jgi:hypothetical protein
MQILSLPTKNAARASPLFSEMSLVLLRSFSNC